ncbi:hypothetical protein N7492_001161 [Penicillium capsulatum]|uniref:Uncharacterized protein n=1 Tax=Penicillium capsulatum TaxID=69766 RepID=A0A9W9IRU6_9EURO|nr:hypothetical protein N7492_001161 [Penicillium capsulatum]KAJ6129783.1 hypothetical protein N7512_002563 [Penicillium capsulatum]
MSRVDQAGWGWNPKRPNGGQNEWTESNERAGKARCSGSSVNEIQFADESLDAAWANEVAGRNRRVDGIRDRDAAALKSHRFFPPSSAMDEGKPEVETIQELLGIYLKAGRLEW